MKKVLVIGDEIKVHHVAENLQELHTANYNDNSIYCVNHPIHVFTKFYQSSEFGHLPDMFYKYAEVSDIQESKDFNSLLTNYRADVEFIVDKNSVVGEIVQYYIDNSNENKIRKLNNEIDRLKLTNADLKVQLEREEINNKDLIAVIEMLRDEINSLKLTNVGSNEHIKRMKISNKEFELELQNLEDEKEVFRKSYNAIVETPTIKVIFELIKVWWVNKFTLK